jgi:hypothetical protein
VHPYPKSEAREFLEKTISFGDERIRAEVRRGGLRLLELPIIELRYRSFDDAEERLRSFVDDL